MKMWQGSTRVCFWKLFFTGRDRKKCVFLMTMKKKKSLAAAVRQGGRGLSCFSSLRKERERKRKRESARLEIYRRTWRRPRPRWEEEEEEKERREREKRKRWAFPSGVLTSQCLGISQWSSGACNWRAGWEAQHLHQASTAQPTSYRRTRHKKRKKEMIRASIQRLRKRTKRRKTEERVLLCESFRTSEDRKNLHRHPTRTCRVGGVHTPYWAIPLSF